MSIFAPAINKSQNKDYSTCVWSTVVPHTDRPNERGEIHRCWDAEAHPQLGFHGCRTLYEAFRRGVSLNPLGPCLGFRAVGTNGFATPYIYSTYTECLSRIDAIAAGIDVLKLAPPNNEDKMKVLGLYLPNCMEWILMEQGLYCLGGITVPMYPTLDTDTLQYIVKQTQLKTILCTRTLFENVCQVKKSGECPNLQVVIVVDGITTVVAKLAEEAGLQVHSLAKIEAVGAHYIATEGGHAHTPPNADDICTFCYTSGTTGPPKGALLTHGNLISTIAGICQGNPLMEVNMNDRHLSYLPLAHIFERFVINQMFIGGASVAFYRGDPTQLIEDIVACRPTALIAAPRVLNKIYDKIHAGMAAAGGRKKKLFDRAVATKSRNLLQHGHLKHFLYDKLIFNKIKAALGMDCLRFLGSGSAPLSANVMIFFRCLLGIPVMEGYGQTEGAAGATMSHIDDTATAGHVGGPIGSVEIVLVDVPEMGYLHTDTNHRGQPCMGRGEICVRGPNIFKGYYKQPDKTREMIDDEGWLHSGDIGLWRPDGNLQIIDRKKNIFKLSQGEYVAPEKVENILINSPLIGQCFVYGDSLQSTLVALVVPDEEAVRAWAKQQQQVSLTQASLVDMCASKVLSKAVMDDVKRLSKEANLHGFEMVRSLALISEPFSVENGMLTPTFKIKRQQVRDRYEKEIEILYAEQTLPSSKL